MNIGDLIVRVAADIDGFKSAMGQVSSVSTTTANAAAAAASKINTVFAAAFGAGITTLAFGAASKFESAFAQIQRSTGATEEKLKGLEESFTNVYKKSAAGSEEVAAAISILSTRTGATGKDLEDLTLKTIKLAKTQREDLGTIVPLITRAFGDWSIASQYQAKAMDYLRTVSQTTGTSVARLSEQIVYAGAPLRQLGYNFEQSAALIGKFEKEGVNTELVLGGMKAALQKFAKDGVTDTAEAWAKFVEGVRGGSISLQDVLKEVGAKRGVDLYRAITEGRFEIDEMVKSAKKLAEEGGASIETMKTKLTKMQHEVESVIASHYQLITAVGLGMPVITALGSAFKSMGVSAVGALGGVEQGLGFLVGKIGIVSLAIADLVLAWKAWQNIKDTAVIDSKNGLDNGFTFTGFGGVMTPQTKVARPDAADYVKNLMPPKEEPKPTSSGGREGISDEEAKKAFSALGIKDLQDQLDDALAAFEKLRSAGRISEAGQIEQATQHITDLRAQIAELRAGWKEMPKGSADLLKTLGVEFPPDARGRIQEMGAALTEFSQRVQGFVGPQQNGLMDGKLTEAWTNYAHAVASADDEFKKHIADVPWLQFAKAVDEVDLAFQNHSSHSSLYIKTEADLNEQMRQHLNVLRELPEAHRPVVDIIMDAFGAVKGLTDAYHYFNIQTPADLAAHAQEARRQYQIIKDAAGDAAVAAQIAWHKFTLAQIELDHALGDTDQELYEQRKRMAEDALKHLEGDAKGTTETIRRHVWSASEAMQQATQSAFDSTYRALARSLVTWKEWGKNLKNVALDTFENMLSIALKAFLKPLEDAVVQLAGKLGGALGGVFGGGSAAPAGGSSAPGVPGGVGAGGAGGAASAATGWMGVVNMVSGAVTAISSVIGNFQMHGMNEALNSIGNHTLRIFNVVAQTLDEHYLFKGQLFLKLDDIWNSIRAVGGAGSGGDSLAMLGSIRDYTRLQVAKLDEFIVPKMDRMIAALEGGRVASANGPYFDFRGSTFGAGLTQQGVDSMMESAYRKAKSKLG